MKKVIVLTLIALRAVSVYSQWTQVNTGLSDTSVIALAVSGTNIFAGTDMHGVFVSNDNGNHWTSASTGLTNMSITAIAISGTNIFAGTFNGIFLSTNNGNNWTAVNTGLPANCWIHALAISGTNIYAGTNSNGVFLSTNNGGNWTAINTGLSNPDISSLVTEGSNVFVGTSGNGLFLSTNNGGSWIAVNNGLSTPIIGSLAVNGTTIYATTASIVGSLFMSTNDGSNWTDIGMTIPASYSFAFDNPRIFTGTASGIYLSSNNGSTWSNVSTGLNLNNNILSLAIIGTDIFASASLNGIYRRSLSEIMGVVEYGENENSLRVYPNPASDRTTITFSEAGSTTEHTIKVMNTLGECIQQLTTSNKEQILDMSGYAKGVYFVRIESSFSLPLSDGETKPVYKKLVLQ